MTSPLAFAPLPIAVFRGSQHESVVASEAWRQLFADDVPPPIAQRLEDAQRSQQPSEAELRIDTLIEALGITTPRAQPLLHYAARQDVLAWWPTTT